MTALTANDFATQIVAQTRIQEPSFSGEVGTPERKMIDAMSQALADNQIDLTGLQSALNIDSKFGSNLDQFTSLFGMQRQQASVASGYVVFSRTTPAPATITIPNSVVIQSNASSVQYTTQTSGSIATGGTSSDPVQIQATVTGSIGNTAANTLTNIQGQIVPGVTSVTNPNALDNGANQEDDNSFKVRFKNTWARNLAGVEDQYLALALAGLVSTKALVVGAQSRYQEYTQVPSFDDNGFLAGVQTTAQNTSGIQNQWTTALSQIPYAKQIYTNVQVFVSNGQQGPPQYFYTPNVDFQFNVPPLATGDTLRNGATTTVSGTQTLPITTLTVASTNGFTTSGTLNASGETLSYTGTTGTTFTGVTGATGTLTGGTLVYQVPTSTNPNFTFLNVYNPASGTPAPGLQSLAPEDIVLTEFSYISQASRNDIVHGVNNAVDIYVNGSNDIQTSCIMLPNVANTVFNTNPNSPWYYENYRRDGNNTKRPQLNNYITPMFQQPIDGLPASIVLNGVTFNLGVDYWLVHEYDSLGGTIRARDGIEWNLNSSPSNNIFTASQADNIVLEVDNYLYDANIATLQASIESSTPATIDALVHKARTRYFKLDITVMYSPNSNFAVVNAAIAVAVQSFFNNQYFGSVIQLSDLLEVIHQVQGVDNVRWSNDLPTIPNLIRVMETDVNGNPLHGASVDRLLYGGSTVTEQQTLYVVGAPSGTTNGVADSFTLSWSAAPMTTAAIPFIHTNGSPVTASDIQTAIRAVQPGSGLYHNLTVTQDARPTTNVVNPITSFTIIYGANGTATVPVVTNNITSSSYTFDADYFLLDNELPSLSTGQITGDTLPGLIIRPRTQNTFTLPGLV